jgi:RimJ/RimL family protein N-acetyltransferase
VIEPAFALETRRLRLRPYRLEDLDDAYAILGDAETMRFYPAPYSRERVREWIETNIQRYATDGFGLWAMEDIATGEFLGNCGPVRREVDGTDEIEIGWHVKRTRWGRGIAPEAGAASRDWVFASTDFHRVISLIRPENEPSRRVAEKIGMTVWKETIHGHVPLPHYVYAVTRHDAAGGPGGPAR